MVDFIYFCLLVLLLLLFVLIGELSLMVGNGGARKGSEAYVGYIYE
jgi:hypothetical protein